MHGVLRVGLWNWTLTKWHQSDWKERIVISGCLNLQGGWLENLEQWATFFNPDLNQIVTSILVWNLASQLLPRKEPWLVSDLTKYYKSHMHFSTKTSWCSTGTGCLYMLLFSEERTKRAHALFFFSCQNRFIVKNRAAAGPHLPQPSGKFWLLLVFLPTGPTPLTVFPGLGQLTKQCAPLCLLRILGIQFYFQKSKMRLSSTFS